jgi:hypothetical protein
MVEKLLKAHDTNSAIFRDSLIALDVAVQSIASAVDDFCCGRPIHKNVVDGVEHVDYNAYISEFRKKLAAMDQMEHVTASPIVTPDEEEVHVFGGTG